MRDPGLQSERTALAWQRTGISASAVTGVAVVAAAHDGSALLVAVVGLLGAGVAVLGAVAVRGHGRTPSPWGRLVATAGAALLLCLTGLTLALVAVLR